MKRFLLALSACALTCALAGCDDSDELTCLANCDLYDSPEYGNQTGITDNILDVDPDADVGSNSKYDDQKVDQGDKDPETNNPSNENNNQNNNENNQPETDACNNTCTENQKCDNGTCVLDCGNLTNCNETCVDLATLNLENCSTCAANYCDGDNNLANGCEINVMADDTNNCGGCGITCDGDQKCSQGECVDLCSNGLTYCDGNCTDLASLHLGNCTTCATNYCDADNNKANGCEINAKGNDKNNCGGCGIKCGDDETCSAGVCKSNYNSHKVMIYAGGDTLNVRSGAGTDNSILGSLNTYDYVTVTGETNGWYKISYKSQTGYISAAYTIDASDSIPGRKAIDHAEKFLYSKNKGKCTYDFLTYEPKITNFTNLDIYGSTYNYGYNDNCANFVTSNLKSVGLISKNLIAVSQIKNTCANGTDGYKTTTISKVKAGDIWMNDSYGHTELVVGYSAKYGKAILIGSNNFSSGDTKGICVNTHYTNSKYSSTASSYQRVTYAAVSGGHFCTRQ